MPSCPTCQASLAEGVLVCPSDGTQLSPLVGKVLGERYRILRLLGSGGMGDVYLAEHVLLGKKMAVKVLKDELCRNEELVRRFQQEAVAAGQIGQENIVNVTDFGRTPEGSLYFVMEALQGLDLTSLLRRDGPFAPERALTILVQVCRALAAAHACGIVHRDLKAENVMVIARDDGSELVKVLDFGISKMSLLGSATGENRITQAGMVMGTPDYMSPEQAQGDAVDHRSDIYSFGILAYELLTGSVPFTAPNLTGVLLKHISEPPEPPSRRAPERAIPQDLEALILRTLEKSPARRPQSMAEVWEALRACLMALGLRTTGPAPAVLRAPSDAGRRETAPAPLPLAPDAFARTMVRTSPRPDAAVAALAPPPAVAPAPSSPLQQEAQAEKPLPARKSRGGWVAAAVGVVVLGAAAGGYVLKGPGHTAAPQPMALELPPVPVPATLPPSPPVTAEAPPAGTPAPSAEPSVSPMPAPVPSRPAAPPHKLTQSDIGRVFAHSERQLRHCLQSNRDQLPDKQGQIILSFTVERSGAVSDAHLTTPGLQGGKVETCVAARVREMKFPRHVEPKVTFDLPLQYGVNE